MKKKNILSDIRTSLIGILILTSFFGSIAIFGTAAVDPNLVLYLPLDEGSGTKTYDDSGNGHVGIIERATWITGIAGNALEFDGNYDLLYINETDILNSVNSVTIACWIKVQEAGPLRFIVKTNGFGLFQDDNYTGIAISVPATNNAKGLNPFDVWFQIAGTYDGTDIKFYIDGVLIETTNWPGTMSLGAEMFVVAFYTRCWKGALDEVCVWNKALTAEEVESHYANTNCASIPISPVFLALLTLVGTIFIFKKRK